MFDIRSAIPSFARPLIYHVAVRKRLSDPLLFLVVSGAVFATRLPFLGPGLGADADAWRVYLAGRSIAETGAYTASRLPGYPVIEYVTALAWPYGYTTLNALTALMSAVAVAFFALTLRRLGARTWWAGTAALAFVPVMFVHSIVLMDYAWAVAFMLGALYFAVRGRLWPAGALLGLAIGCRLTSAAALIPLSVMAWAGSADLTASDSAGPPSGRSPGRSPATCLRDTAILAGTAVVVAALLFLPVIVRYGPSLLTFVESDATPRAAWERLRSATGDLGLAAIAFGLVSIPLAATARRWLPLRRVMAGHPRRWTLAWGLGVALYLVAYARLPQESGYLLPVVPFALLIGAALLDERAWLGACALLTVASLVGFSGAAPVAGPLVVAQRQRAARLVTAERAVRRSRGLAPGAVILAGSTYPAIQAIQLNGAPTPVRFLYRPDPAEIGRLVGEGHAIYYLEGVDKLVRAAYGIDLAAIGARPLDE